MREFVEVAHHAVLSNMQELLDIDDEFHDNFEDILDRFYQLFDGIYKVTRSL